jgi:hypothetical protein
MASNRMSNKHRVPQRSWIAASCFCDREPNLLIFEKQVTKLSARIAELRRICEALKFHAPSDDDHVNSIRLHEILAEASHLLDRAFAAGGSVARVQLDEHQEFRRLMD